MTNISVLISAVQVDVRLIYLSFFILPHPRSEDSILLSNFSLHMARDLVEFILPMQSLMIWLRSYFIFNFNHLSLI